MKYEVEVTITISSHVTVEADTASEAKQLVKEKIDTEDAHYGLDNPSVEYGYAVEEVDEEDDYYEDYKEDDYDDEDYDDEDYY